MELAKASVVISPAAVLSLLPIWVEVAGHIEHWWRLKGDGEIAKIFQYV